MRYYLPPNQLEEKLVVELSLSDGIGRMAAGPMPS